MALPTLAAVPLTAPEPSLPLLVVGPSLGTSVETLWSASARRLADSYRVIGWDLPGHGRSPQATAAFSVGDLAAAVLALIHEGDEPFAYAGDSLGGAVGLCLLLAAPDRVSRATLIATGLRIGTAQTWEERAGLVRTGGTQALAESAPARWFAPGFARRNPGAAAALIAALEDADDESYALACEALAAFDVRTGVEAITAPVLAVAGRHDAVTTVADLTAIADGVQHGRLAVLEDAAHLPPVEAPSTLATLIVGHQRAATG